MPVRFLTDAERERHGSFPREIPDGDLYYAFCTLTSPDFAVIPNRSVPANRLGFALSLCAVRFLGFCPEDLSYPSRAITRYVGD